MAEFIKAYERTSFYEGGYANVKGDRGGETYRGISRVFHPNWSGWGIIDNKKPLKHNQIVSSASLDALVKIFYKTQFWDKVQGDYIDSQIIAEFLYDYYVHSGKRAIIALQKILKIGVDGIVGRQTLGAVNQACAKELLEDLKKERINFLTALSTRPGQSKFKSGWLNRVRSFTV